MSKLQTELDTSGLAGDWKPKIVFEPTPPSCHPDQREWFEKVASGVEVLSWAS